MSSPLPKALRMSIKDAARNPKTGLVQCAMCGKEFDDSWIQVDHITPEADGGSHDPANLQPLCTPPEGAGCHRLKSRGEAKARAKREKTFFDTNDRPGWLIGAGLSLLGTGVAARCAWLVAQGEWPGPFLSTLYDGLGLGLLSVAGLAAAVAARRGVQTVATFEDFEEAEDEEEVSTTPIERLREILTDVIPTDFTVMPVDPGNAFKVAYGQKVPDQDDGFRLKVLERVNSKMPGRWRLAWEPESDFVVMSPRPNLPRMIRHPGPRGARRWSILPMGEDSQIDLSLTAHTLIIGRTSAGKTALIRTLVLAVVESAVKGEVDALLLDPKRVELIGFRGWPGVREVVTTEQAMWDMPLDLVAEMEERYRLFEEEKVRLNTHKPRIVICDEYEDYVKSMQAMWTAIDPATGKPRKQPGESEPPPVAAMAKLLRKARKCGIHIIIGTQRPDAKWFGGAARDNCECRIVVGSPSRGAILMAFERSDVGRDIPATLKGRFTMQNLDGAFVEDQAFYVADPADADGKNTAEDWAHLEAMRAALERVAA